MCKVIEDMLREEREEVTKEVTKEVIRTTTLRMLEDGTLDLEKIASISGLPLDEVKKLQAGQNM